MGANVPPPHKPDHRAFRALTLEVVTDLTICAVLLAAATLTLLGTLLIGPGAGFVCGVIVGFPTGVWAGCLVIRRSSSSARLRGGR